PQQAQSAMTSDPRVASELALLRQSNKVIFGNLLTLPIADGGILYVEPLYTQRNSANAFPQLARVMVSFTDTTGIRVGYAPTLAEALDQVFGSGTGSSATRPSGEPAAQPETGGQTTPAPTPAPPAPGQTPDKAAAVAELDAALANLQSAQAGGDFKAYGEALDRLQRAVNAYQSAGG
ncbi:MAG: hypothetical protein ACE1Y7_09265, partial [Lysobacteraceae bacterium]